MHKGGLYALLLLIIVGVKLTGSQPAGCSEYYQAWLGYVRTGGMIQNGVTTLAACREICNADEQCVSFMFSDVNECVTHSDPRLDMEQSSVPDITLYIKMLKCEDCFVAVFPRLTGSAWPSANSRMETDTVDSCLASCLVTSSCASINFDSANQNCFHFPVFDDVPVDDLMGRFASTHLRKIMCLSPEPCAAPPGECTINSAKTTPCLLPGGQTCGVGSSEQHWDCLINGSNQLFVLERKCCDTPCPAGEPCRNPTDQLCGSSLEESLCLEAGCCWMGGSSCMMPKRLPNLFCADVYPTCEDRG